MMEKMRQGGLRVLFADDEAHLRDLMQMELPRLGHEVTVCADGTAALRPRARVIRRGPARYPHARNQRHRGPWPDQADQPRHAGDHPDRPSHRGYGRPGASAGGIRLSDQAVQVGRARGLAATHRRTQGPVQQDRSPGDPAQERRGSSSSDRRDTGHAAGPTPDRHDRALRGHRHDPGRDRDRQGAGRAQPPREERSRQPRVHPRQLRRLPENLVESELFGHRKGAFTGADANRKGLFEVANGGTLFLDEVGELDKSVQVKLLRFLESGEIRRVGENEPFRVDVRVLCATNRDLRDMVKNELFREDLFFRLNTFEIFLPALRDRKADIAELARHLLTRYAARRGMTESSFSPESLEMLAAHDWPGNIRELANAIERASILAGNGSIHAEHLPTQFPARGRTQHSATAHPPIASPHFTIPEGSPTLRDIEMSYIQAVLEKHNGNKPAASKELGISLKTLYNKINQLQQN